MQSRFSRGQLRPAGWKGIQSELRPTGNFIYVHSTIQKNSSRHKTRRKIHQGLAFLLLRKVCSNSREQNIIDEFARDYRPEMSIWWYTRECFTYQILNRALRTLVDDTIVNMGFSICDLHRQITSTTSRGLSWTIVYCLSWTRTNTDGL
jgi:hypothetical protein